jgi:S-formylglutathione hydrolase FrmB
VREAVLWLEDSLSASTLLDAPLIAGPLPTAISAVGAAGAVYILARRGVRWWTRAVPIGLLVGVSVAGLAAVVVAVFRPFPDLLPVRMLIWTGVAAAGSSLAWANMRARRRRQVLAVLALLAVLATSGVKANAFYGYRPTLAAALGLPAANEIDLSSLPRTEQPLVAPTGMPTAAAWHRPPDMPTTGKISKVQIPGRTSGFPARPAWIYLAPAYLSSSRPRLPVLVLIAGQPGGPEDWLLAGRLAEVADRFAAAHDGLAPVIIMPDATGSSFGNPMCLDSRLGQAESYLATDVPGWAAANLQVDPEQRAIGGFSFGGTCALQLAVRRPDVYPTFLDISGQAEPTLGDHAHTVRAAFGGDEDAFRRVNPLDELRRATYPRCAGVFDVGRDDPDFRAQAKEMVRAARAAGMAASLAELPGAHSWSMASEALSRALPWISARTGLLDPALNPPPG